MVSFCRDGSTYFSPRRVFIELDELYSSVKITTRNERKVIEELQTTAAFVAGIAKHDGIERWIRLSEVNESSPDTYVLELHPYAKSGKVIGQEKIEHPVEVVTFNDYSSEDFLSFLNRTKLSNKYPSTYTLLCMLNKKQKRFELKQASDSIKSLGVDFTVGIVAKTSEDESYTSALLSPGYYVWDEYKLMDLMKTQSKDIVKLTRGAGTHFIAYQGSERLIEIL